MQITCKRKPECTRCRRRHKALVKLLSSLYLFIFYVAIAWFFPSALERFCTWILPSDSTGRANLEDVVRAALLPVPREKNARRRIDPTQQNIRRKKKYLFSLFWASLPSGICSVSPARLRSQMYLNGFENPWRTHSTPCSMAPNAVRRCSRRSIFRRSDVAASTSFWLLLPFTNHLLPQTRGS